jgi:hypothetical protein
MNLGKLKRLPARQIWNDEARDFTPWLFDNITELGQTLGLELQVERTEVACGPYSADIFAIDTLTSQRVVIENQIGKTDHDHLGKCLTYTAVLEATTIVWIATEFTPEHQKTLDWLNDHTRDEISFYGVQLELWQIDDSKPASRFNLLCKPNVAVRQAALTLSELSDTKRMQLDFWTKFYNKLLATKKIGSLQTPRGQYWYDIAVGKSNIHISNTFNTDQFAVGLRIYVRHQIADQMLPFLQQHQSEIHAAAGTEMNWNPNPNARDKVITVTRTFDPENEKSQEEILDWLVKLTITMRECLIRILKGFA